MHAVDRGAPVGAATPLQVALLVPCHNEEATVAAVVAAFRESLPAARCHVFDSRSGDDTAARACAAGATVHPVALLARAMSFAVRSPTSRPTST